MKRSSSSQPSPHAVRNAYKYAAATKARNLTEAEAAARGLQTMLSDPKRNSQPIYLKRAKDTDEEFLSTVDISINEKKLDWVLDSPLSQTERAQKRAKVFSNLLATHENPAVKKAASAVLTEVTSGRATLYGGLASSKDLRVAMNDLIAALDAAKHTPERASDPKRSSPGDAAQTQVAQPKPVKAEGRAAYQPPVQRQPKPSLSAPANGAPVTRRKPTPDGALLAMVDPNNPARFHVYRGTAKALLDSMKQAPNTHVLRTEINRTAAYLDMRERSAQDGADLPTCRLLYQLARDFRRHPDLGVQKMAQKLQTAARLSALNNRAIPNHPGLQQALAVLAGAS